MRRRSTRLLAAWFAFSAMLRLSVPGVCPMTPPPPASSGEAHVHGHLDANGATHGQALPVPQPEGAQHATECPLAAACAPVMLLAAATSEALPVVPDGVPAAAAWRTPGSATSPPDRPPPRT